MPLVRHCRRCNRTRYQARARRGATLRSTRRIRRRTFITSELTLTSPCDPDCLNRSHGRKPGILLVSTGPLLPPNSGGRIYTWGTTAPLSGEFNYHLISLLTADERAEFTRDRERLTDQYRSAFQ